MPEAIQFSVGGDWSGFERQAVATSQRVQRLFNNLRLDSATERPLGKISASAIEFEKSLKAANARVLTFGASVGVIYGVQRAFSELVKSSITVEKALADINVILQANQQNLSNFSGELFKIARNTAQTFDTVAKAATEFARQGVGLEETLKRTRDALILTRQSGLDFKDAVDTITATLNSFSKAGLDSTQIINKLANVDAAFAVSSADLSEAIKRVGSTAEDAGLSFDQLIAVVTSAQQITARGGAVIGNAFKTIFTRLQRPEVLDQLRDIGIKVRELDGEVRPAIQLFQELAQRVDGLSASQKSQISESVGSLYQINLLKASLSDLSNEYSIYGRALETSINTTDQAISRNEELNRTLSATISRTLTNLTQLGSNIGSSGINQALGGILNQINTTLQSFNEGDTTKIGNKIGTGIIEGLVAYITGPGLILFGGVVAKLTFDSFKFIKEAGKSLLNLNAIAKERAILEQNITNVLSQEAGLTDRILKGTINQAQAERIVLDIIKQQVAERAKVATFTSEASRRAVLGGVNPVSTRRTRAVGEIPQQVETEQALAAGYTPGEVREINLASVGKVYYNSAERIRSFGGGNLAIMPPKTSEAGKNYQDDFGKKFGFDPYKAEGYAPNGFTPYGNFGRPIGHDAFMDTVSPQFGRYPRTEPGYGGFNFHQRRLQEIQTAAPAFGINPGTSPNNVGLAAQGQANYGGFSSYNQQPPTIAQPFGVSQGTQPIKVIVTPPTQPNYGGFSSYGGTSGAGQTLAREGFPASKPGSVGVGGFGGLSNYAGISVGRSLGQLSATEGIALESDIKLFKNSIKKGTIAMGEIPQWVKLLTDTYQLNSLETKKINQRLAQVGQKVQRTQFFANNVQGPPLAPFQQNELQKSQDSLANNAGLAQRLTLIGAGVSQRGGAGDLLLNNLKTAYPTPPVPPRPPLPPSFAFLGGNPPPPDESRRYQQTLQNMALQRKLEENRVRLENQQIKSQEDAAKKAEIRARRQERIQRLTTPVLFASLAAPVIAETSANIIGDETTNQRGGSAIARTLGNTAAFAGTAFGLTGGNPIVTALAGGGALAFGLPDIIKGFTDTIPDLEKALDKLKDSTTRSAEALALYGTSTQEIVNILSGEVKNVQPGTLATLKRTQEESFARLSPERQARLNEFTQQQGLAGITEAQKEFARQDEQEITTKIVEKLIQQISQKGLSSSTQVINPQLARAVAAAGGGFTSGVESRQDLNKEIVPELTKILNEFKLTRGKDNKTLQDFVFTNKETFDRFQKLEPEALIKSLENILIKEGNVNGGQILNSLTSEFEGQDLKFLVDFLRKEILNQQSFDATTKNKELNEIQSRQRAQRIPQFSDEIFKTQLNFDSLIRNIQQRGTLQGASLNNFSTLQSQLSGGFIENQQPFVGPRTLQGLRFRSNLGAIETERFSGFTTARNQFASNVATNFGGGAISNLQDSLQRFTSNKILSNEDVQADALEFLRPFNDRFNKLQELLSQGNLEGGRDETRALIDDLSITRRPLFQGTRGDLRDSDKEKIRIEFLQKTINDLSKSLDDLDNAVELTNQNAEERIDAEKKLNNQVLESIRNQEKINFGGGIGNLTDIRSLKENTLLNQTAFRASLSAGDTQGAGQAAFNLASAQFPFTKQLPKGLEQSIFKGLVDNITATGANRQDAEDIARTQIAAAFPTENLEERLAEDLKKLLPKLDNSTNSITSVLEKMNGAGINVRVVTGTGSSPTVQSGSATSNSVIDKALKVLPKLNDDLDIIKSVVGFEPQRKRPTPLLPTVTGLNIKVPSGGGTGLPNLPVNSNASRPVFNSQFNLAPNLQTRGANNALGLAEVLFRSPLLSSGKELEKLTIEGNNALQEILQTNKGIYDVERRTEALIARINFQQARDRFGAGEISGAEFAGNVVNSNRRDLAATGKLTGREIGESFASQFAYNTRDMYEDLHEGAIELGQTFKSSMKDAFAQVAFEGKKASDALRDFGLGLATRIAGKAIDTGVDAILGGVYSLGSAYFGGGRRFSSGGLVSGGSGVRDDVPAKLTAGEYVIKKSSVDKLGTDYLDALNNNATSFSQVLDNRFDKDKVVTPGGDRFEDASNPGKYVIDKRLSFAALDDPDNPQNAKRVQDEQLYLQNLRAKIEYDNQVDAANKQYRRQIRNTMVSAYIGAALNVAGGALGQYASGFRNTAPGFNATSPQTAPRINQIGLSTPQYANKGGLIKGVQYLASGGTVLQSTSQDTIPAMLTGGEYVIRRDAVNRVGRGFLDQLNRGSVNNQIRGYANGGIVGDFTAPTTAGQGSNELNDSLTKLVEVMSAVRDSLGNKTQTREQSGMTNNFTFSFEVTNNGTSAEVSSDSNTESGTSEKGGLSREQAALLADRMKAVVYKVINDESAPGGLLAPKR
jgi:TP901 family phage tail tape measure protein